MSALGISAILILSLPLVVVIGFFLIWALKLVTGKTGAEGERDEAEETKLVQELYQGFSRMEKRIEALETILLDPDKKDKKQ